MVNLFKTSGNEVHKVPVMQYTGVQIHCPYVSFLAWASFPSE